MDKVNARYRTKNIEAKIRKKTSKVRPQYMRSCFLEHTVKDFASPEAMEGL